MNGQTVRSRALAVTLAMVVGLGVLGGCSGPPDPAELAAQLRSAVASGDDAAVYAAFSTPSQKSSLGGSSFGAARKLSEMYPKLASMDATAVSDAELRMVDPRDDDARITFTEVDGEWLVTSTSVVRSVVETVPYTLPDLTYKTKHLPTGVKIKARSSHPGSKTTTFRVVERDGVEATRTVKTSIMVEPPFAAETWVGTGEKGAARVTRLRTGSKFSKRTHSVTSNSQRVSAKSRNLAVSMRVLAPRKRSRLRVVLLGPDNTVMVGDPWMVRGRYAWTQGLWWWELSRGSGERPRGTWVAVAQSNGRPVKWKVFRVK